jgi:hypothetical protein
MFKNNTKYTEGNDFLFKLGRSLRMLYNRGIEGYAQKIRLDATRCQNPMSRIKEELSKF